MCVCELKLPEDLGDDGDPPLPDADHPLPEGDSGEDLGDDGALWAKGKLELHILIIITFIVSYHVFLRTFLYEKIYIYYICFSKRLMQIICLLSRKQQNSYKDQIVY